MTTPTPDGSVPAVPSSSGDSSAIRDLARALAPEAATFETSALRKGSVVDTFYQTGSTTITVTLSGDTTEIPDIACISTYSPQIGDVVILAKQGNGLLAIGAASATGGWITASLNSGFTHDITARGNLMYRVVQDHGTLKMQWRGAVLRSANTTVCSVGDAYRPSTFISVIACRTAVGGLNDVKIDFSTSGTVELVGTTTSQPIDQSPPYGNHSHNGNTNTLAPGWVSFHGIEYFL